ncbi:PqqD family peptide modification chaperone [Mesorhizobium sp. M0488]|uniref:PqqD family peptide modification chaperone n=1 Tax=unclassified Mesorhizobium TaxID=325217 RepID=UPI0033365296
MGHSDVYTVASSDIVFESFDGEAVVLDLSNGKYFGFSDSGSRIWEALSSGVPPVQLIGAATRVGEVTASEIGRFVAQLLEFGLLALAADAPAQMPSETLLADLARAGDPLHVEIHDDLADLILVDPIHEVEEPVGWPAVKQAT